MYADQCKPDWEELLADLDYTGVHAVAGVLDVAVWTIEATV